MSARVLLPMARRLLQFFSVMVLEQHRRVARLFQVLAWFVAVTGVSACTGAIYSPMHDEPDDAVSGLQQSSDEAGVASGTTTQGAQVRINALHADMLLAQAALADSVAAVAQSELARMRGDIEQSEQWMQQSDELLAKAEQLQQSMTDRLSALARDLAAMEAEHAAKAARNQNDPTPSAIANLQVLVAQLRDELEALTRQLVP